MNVMKIAGAIYVSQAVAGFAIGLTIPWLQFFGVI